MALVCLTFVIEDQGAGIPKSDLTNIFDPFIQSSKPSTGGTGLALCKEIIDGHNGKVWAGNSPDTGAILKFILPQ